MEYTNLDVWIESRKLTNLVYNATKKYPKEEIFGLQNQIRRSAISVPSNIAEGCGRNTNKETIHFLFIARGSLYELETQLYLSSDQNYINAKEFTEILNQIIICKKLLNGFIAYYKKK
ncbi:MULTISPECIES: four helix bundle protein [Chryseobacterium]|jgi:four helix bundle protein|uniref:Four helix bundle protein n=1 Tax=Chryseobacterium takakiae TaxID=1302685 RepID=A0A1M4XJU3_9FLAO|nr:MULTISPECIES: four helix bundle protein [Chryseobacterium]MDR6158016.1 four helix bundle protein [Chryseobacterium sp. SLBN-27]SHE93583.1 four helix bundle protein [Chryseobacterium takakiae]